MIVTAGGFAARVTRTAGIDEVDRKDPGEADAGDDAGCCSPRQPPSPGCHPRRRAEIVTVGGFALEYPAPPLLITIRPSAPVLTPITLPSCAVAVAVTVALLGIWYRQSIAIDVRYWVRTVVPRRGLLKMGLDWVVSRLPD